MAPQGRESCRLAGVGWAACSRFAPSRRHGRLRSVSSLCGIASAEVSDQRLEEPFALRGFLPVLVQMRRGGAGGYLGVSWAAGESVSPSNRTTADVFPPSLPLPVGVGTENSPQA